jgi:hypothetical protein
MSNLWDSLSTVCRPDNDSIKSSWILIRTSRLGGVFMELEIFVPHNELERSNIAALAEYLNSMYYC